MQSRVSLGHRSGEISEHSRVRRQSAALTTASPTRGRVSFRAELVTPYIGLMTQLLARDSRLMRGQENRRAKSETSFGKTLAQTWDLKL